MFTKTQKVIKNIEDDMRGMRNFKKISLVLIFIAIGIFVLSSFCGVTLALPAVWYDSLRGIYHNPFIGNYSIVLTGSAEFDTHYNNVRLADDNTASLLFRGQNGSLVKQAKIRNGYLYVAACAAGVLIYDLADPADPLLVAQYNTPGCAQDIDFYGNYALTAEEYNSDTGVQPPIDHQGGLHIIDVSDPTNPIFVGSSDNSAGGYSFGVTVNSHYVYVESVIVGTTTGYLDVFDLSDISSPQLVKSILKPYGFRWRSGVVDGNYLYTAADRPAGGAGGLHIFDVSDPSNPTEVGSYITGVSTWAPVSKVGNYVYLPGRYNGVYIIDVSDPTNPILVTTIDTPSAADNVAVSGGYGYVADQNSGLQIFNTTTNLIVGSYDTPDQAYDVDLYNNYAYVIDHSSIQVINVSDPTNPTLIKEIKSMFGSYTGLAASGNFAYVAHSNGMTTYNISDPYNPIPIRGTYLSVPALGVAVSPCRSIYGFSCVYVANGTSGLRIMGVWDVKQIEYDLGSLDTSGTANKVAVSGNYAYVADGASGLQIIDISNSESPTSTATIATTGYAYGADLYDNYVLLAEGTAGFRIIDITDPTNATTTVTIDTPGTAKQVVASGNFAYVADTTSFRIYDISTIAVPVLRGTIATTDTNSVAAGSDNYIFASSPYYSGGSAPSSVYLTIDVSDPDAPIVTDYKYTTGDSTYVAVSGDYLYAADGDSGLAVFSHGYTTSTNGQVTSLAIAPLEIGSWDRIVINNTLNGQVITYQVLDSVGALIPDSVLLGNAVGFSASGTSTTIDLHILSSTTYPAIKIKANLSTSSKNFSPSVDSWDAYYIKAKAGDDTTSNGSASFDATSSVGDSYTCAWDFDSSDGVDWNNPDSASCQATYDYTSKGGGSYTATLRIKQGTNTAYDYDTRVVAVTVGSGGSTPTPPPVETPIPSTIALSLNPSSLFADSVSQSVLSVEVFDQFNNHVVNNTLIDWSIFSGSGSLASVSTSTVNGLASNTYTASAQAGDVVIKACTANLKCAQKTITLNVVQGPSVLTTISISPVSVNLQVNATQQFTATAKDQYSQTMPGVTYIWRVSDENLANITNTGLLTAKNAGAINVIVSSGLLSDQAQVTITSLSTPPVPPTPKPPTVPTPPTPGTPGTGTITPPSLPSGGPETGIGTGAEAPSENIPPTLPIQPSTDQSSLATEEKVAQPSMVVRVSAVFEKAKEIYQTKILNNKTVQKVNQKAVLPVIATASVLNVAATVPAAASTLPLLQYFLQIIKFVFTQPAYLFARRRKSWGTVYDAVTKQAIGLAMVRLYELVPSLTERGSIKKLIQTKVTGPDGRYFFAVKPNTDYQLEVNSVDYVFPSKYLNQQPSDRLYPNLYYGSVFRSGPGGLINFNLPLDLQEGKTIMAGSTKKVKSSFANLEQFSSAPQDEKEKAYRQVKRQSNLRKLAQGISYLSPGLALLNLIISPNTLTLIFFFIHLALLFIFRIFNPNVLIKPLGKIFNLSTQESIGQGLVYLFEPQFNKLIQTQIVDAQGRYGFLIGEEKYYLVAQKPGYVFPQDKVEIVGQVEGIAKKDLGLKKI